SALKDSAHHFPNRHAGSGKPYLSRVGDHWPDSPLPSRLDHRRRVFRREANDSREEARREALPPEEAHRQFPQQVAIPGAALPLHRETGPGTALLGENASRPLNEEA